MHIYIASTPYYLSRSLVKIGCARYLISEIEEHLAGCPPRTTMKYDMRFYKIWETDAQTLEELLKYEDILHNRFHYFRLMRDVPNDSEWFEFRACDPLTEIALFLENKKLCPWIKKCFSPGEIARLVRCISDCGTTRGSSPIFLQRQTRKNTLIIRDQRNWLASLNKMRGSTIAQVRDYIMQSRRAVHDSRGICDNRNAKIAIIAMPSNYGKTFVICRAMQSARSIGAPEDITRKYIPYNLARRVIICVSNIYDIPQWRNTLFDKSSFKTSEIFLIDAVAITDGICVNELSSIMRRDQYCIVLPYNHSHKIIKATMIVSENARKLFDLLIIDDTNNSIDYIGALPMFAQEQGIPCIACTSIASTTNKCLNTCALGPIIANVSIRDLINRGILPDYHIWALYDHIHCTRGIINGAKCIVEAWRAVKTVNIVAGREIKPFSRVTHILHHLLIFVANQKEANELGEFFSAQEEMIGTRIIVAKQEPLGETINAVKEFDEASRAILITCCDFSENTNILNANAVAIMRSEANHEQIAQMIFCAGRWSNKESVFHVLVPITGDGLGYSACPACFNSLGDILSSLASYDSQILDEVRARACANNPAIFEPDDYIANPMLSENATGLGLEHVIAENFKSDDSLAQLRKCFIDVRKNVTARASIRDICISRNIDTSAQYHSLRANRFAEWTELPKDPRPPGETWYDFLHSRDGVRICVDDFMREVINRYNLRDANSYAIWYCDQLEETKKKLPRAEYINDGYFGGKYPGYDSLIKSN